MRPGAELLLIGYGNELRGDDAAGPALARAAEGTAGVRALAVRQLTPELAAEVARADAVVFADACPGTTAAESVPLTPRCHSIALGHACDPSWLLGLAATLYGRCPGAWLLALPAVRFDLGAGLSPEAERGVGQGRQHLAALLEGESCTRSA